MPITFALILILLTLCLSTHAGPFKEPVAILGTSFEEGLEPWVHNGEAEFTLDESEVHSGARSARITVREGTRPAYQQLKFVFGPVAQGDEHSVSLWVRSKLLSEDTGAYGALQYLDGAGQRVGIFHTRTSPGNGARGWELLTIDGKAPEGTQRASVDLILHAQGTAWFDDVKVTFTGRDEPWPDLGDAPRQVTIDTGDVIHPSFGGVGFHAFHHIFPASERVLNEVIFKRWREVRPSFARVNDQYDWDPPTLDAVAVHFERFKETGTVLYQTTWGPKDTQPGEERAAYARRVVDNLEYLVREKGIDNLKYYCMTNELSLGAWGALINGMDKFKDYHRELYEELQRRGLDIGLLASDASPIEWWHSIGWAAAHMDEITAVYGGHHYINSQPLTDLRFYEWFRREVRKWVTVAESKGKNFIIGEFGCKQDGSIRDGKRQDVCIYWDTPEEPMVAIQLADATLAAINAGVWAMGYWTFMDFPDDYRPDYVNKWGMFKCSGDDYSTRAHYYAFGLLTRYFRGPATVFRTSVNDPHLRVAALRSKAGGYSIAVLNRYAADAPLSLDLLGATPDRPFRKYVYDPRNVPQHPHGDLQDPIGTVEMAGGKLQDTLGMGTLTIYTTDYEEEAPAAVTGLSVVRNEGGSRTLTWQASPEPDLCYYRVFCSDAPGFTLNVGSQIGSTIATRFVDDRADAGETRSYVVLAVDSSGNVSPAN